MRKSSLFWLLLSGLALAQPALTAAERTLGFPLTRSQGQTLLTLQGTLYDQEVRSIDRRGHLKVIGELNQQAVDAFCEWFLFAVALVDGQTPAEIPPGKTFAAHLQQILVHSWVKLSPDNQQKLLNFPAYWSAVRRDWPRLSSARKQSLVNSWRAALSPLLQASEKQELARACLADLQSTYRNPQSTPAEINQALQRLDSAARRMSADGDPESRALAGVLQNAMLSVQSQQDQKRALQEIDARKASLSAPSDADYNRVFRQINQGTLSRYQIGH